MLQINIVLGTWVGGGGMHGFPSFLVTVFQDFFPELSVLDHHTT